MVLGLFSLLRDDVDYIIKNMVGVFLTGLFLPKTDIYLLEML